MADEEIILKRIIQELRESNPYPENVFLPRDEKAWEAFHAALEKELGEKGDGFMGDHGRKVWNNCIDMFEELFNEASGSHPGYITEIPCPDCKRSMRLFAGYLWCDDALCEHIRTLNPEFRIIPADTKEEKATKKRLIKYLKEQDKVKKSPKEDAEESFFIWLMDNINAIYIKEMKEKLDLDMATVQLHCAGVFYWGGGITIEQFIRENSLNQTKYLKLAKKENMKDYVIKAIKDTIE